MNLSTVILLGLATARVWRLAAIDDLPLLVRARAWLVGETDVAVFPGAPGSTTTVKHYARPTLRHWLSCPWCSGAPVALGAVALWREAPSVAVWALGALAVSEIVGLIVRNFDPTED